MEGKTIGIPRALLYYYLFPLWQVFFEELGFQIVLSSPTDKRTVNLGIEKAVDEVCYPIKIYYGHVANLLGKVDYLFLPRLVSIQKNSYICPKFMGLPDMIKAGFDQLPELIEQSFNSSRNEQGVRQGLEAIGARLKFPRKQIRQAIKRAFAALESYEYHLKQGKTPMELLDGCGREPAREGQLTIGLLGHGYNLYDAYASMNIIQKLKGLGANVLTPEMLAGNKIKMGMAKFPKRMFWTLGEKVMGSAFYLETLAKVDGLVHVSSFGCGPDSMVAELMERLIRRRNQKPFLNLVIDEHTGEAGLDTRLEAFIDMLDRRRVS